MPLKHSKSISFHSSMASLIILPSSSDNDDDDDIVWLDNNLVPLKKRASSAPSTAPTNNALTNPLENIPAKDDHRHKNNVSDSSKEEERQPSSSSSSTNTSTTSDDPWEAARQDESIVMQLLEADIHEHELQKMEWDNARAEEAAFMKQVWDDQQQPWIGKLIPKRIDGHIFATPHDLAALEERIDSSLGCSLALKDVTNDPNSYLLEIRDCLVWEGEQMGKHVEKWLRILQTRFLANLLQVYGKPLSVRWDVSKYPRLGLKIQYVDGLPLVMMFQSPSQGGVNACSIPEMKHAVEACGAVILQAMNGQPATTLDDFKTIRTACRPRDKEDGCVFIDLDLIQMPPGKPWKKDEKGRNVAVVAKEEKQHIHEESAPCIQQQNTSSIQPDDDIVVVVDEDSNDEDEDTDTAPRNSQKSNMFSDLCCNEKPSVPPYSPISTAPSYNKERTEESTGTAETKCPPPESDVPKTESVPQEEAKKRRSSLKRKSQTTLENDASTASNSRKVRRVRFDTTPSIQHFVDETFDESLAATNDEREGLESRTADDSDPPEEEACISDTLSKCLEEKDVYRMLERVVSRGSYVALGHLLEEGAACKYR